MTQGKTTTQKRVQYDGQEVMALHTLQQDLIWFIEQSLARILIVEHCLKLHKHSTIWR